MTHTERLALIDSWSKVGLPALRSRLRSSLRGYHGMKTGVIASQQPSWTYRDAYDQLLCLMIVWARRTGTPYFLDDLKPLTCVIDDVESEHPEIRVIARGTGKGRHSRRGPRWRLAITEPSTN